MSNYPEGNFIVRFLVWILGKLGWWSCSLEQHNAECKRYNDLRGEKESLAERNRELNRRLNKANKIIEEISATSIQEQTLIFIPKILAVFTCVVLLSSWIGQQMLTMAQSILGQLERFIQ